MAACAAGGAPTMCADPALWRCLRFTAVAWPSPPACQCRPSAMQPLVTFVPRVGQSRYSRYLRPLPPRIRTTLAYRVASCACRPRPLPSPHLPGIRISPPIPLLQLVCSRPFEVGYLQTHPLTGPRRLRGLSPGSLPCPPLAAGGGAPSGDLDARLLRPQRPPAQRDHPRTRRFHVQIPTDAVPRGAEGAGLGGWGLVGGTERGGRGLGPLDLAHPRTGLSNRAM
jgi:hypothetical protein